MEQNSALKRFYKTVNVSALDDGSYAILLDKRHLKSPAKRSFILPNARLAEEIAKEWDAQEKYINARTMPLMALASTAIDRIAEMRAGVIEQICAYGETDLICYRTDDPADLAQRQIDTWQPYLDWMARTYNAPLETQIGILHKQQPRNSLDAIQQAVEALNQWQLAALSSATHSTGSIVLGLALVTQHIKSEQAFTDSQVDETYQIELWGEDWETADRRAALKADLNAVERWMTLL